MTMVNFGCTVLATVLGVLTFTLTLTLVHTTLPKRNFQYSRVTSLDNVLFKDNVMFDDSVRSELDCGELCTSTSGCYFFTFYTGNRCRGHSVAETSPAAGTPTVGAKTYIADEWLNTPCGEASECSTLVDNVQCYQGQCKCAPGYRYTGANRTCVEHDWFDGGCKADRDCPDNNNAQCYQGQGQGQCKCAPAYLYTAANRICVEHYWLDEACTVNSDCPTNINNVQCFSGKCNCVPGYYYSVSTRLCIPACPDRDLQPDFTLYPLHRMEDNNLERALPAADLNACWTLCLNYYSTNGIHCRLAEFYFVGPACNLQNVTPLDVPSAFVPDSNHHIMQRKCA